MGEAATVVPANGGWSDEGLVISVVIFGSRTLMPTFDHVEAGLKELDAPLDPTELEIISGGCRGPDSIGAAWAARYGFQTRFFRPDWRRYGLAAGPRRNAQMAEVAHRGLAFWDGESTGTSHMIECMRRLIKPVVIRIAPNLLGVSATATTPRNEDGK